MLQDWATKNNVELKPATTLPAPYNAATENISNGHDEIIWAITKRDRRFFSASADRTVRVWDAVYGRCLHVLEGHQRPVLSLAATDAHLFSGSYDHTIRAWDMGSMRLVKSMQGETHPLSRPPVSALFRLFMSWCISGVMAEAHGKLT